MKKKCHIIRIEREKEKKNPKVKLKKKDSKKRTLRTRLHIFHVMINKYEEKLKKIKFILFHKN